MTKAIAILGVILIMFMATSAFSGQVLVTGRNPIFTNGEPRFMVQELLGGGSGGFAACDEMAHDYNSFKVAMLRRMRQKDTDFTICFQAGFQPMESDFLGWWDRINREQDIPWLSYSWDHLWYKYSYDVSNRVTQSSYTFVYMYNHAQEMDLETAVRAKVRELITSDMDMPTREKIIHDWVVKHVSYDESQERHSDYDAFFEGTAVCQGYTLLTDRMLTMAGIEDKMVMGKAGDMDHTWNMVELCGSWFHLDTTWDDPVGMDPDYITWDYFNVTDRALESDHTWSRSDYSACSTTYYDGYCQGKVENSCSIFAPEQCLDELACMRVSGTWSGEACSVPGSDSGDGGGNDGGDGNESVYGFPSAPMDPVVYPTHAIPSTTVTVPSGVVLLTPQLSVGDCDSVSGYAIAYIYLPDAYFGFSVPAMSVCDNGIETVSIGTGSVDFTGYSGRFYIYFGYIDDGGAINYNVYELMVE